MKNINNEILTICINIDKNIQNFKDNRGFISQNILSQLRNLVEHTCLRICNPKGNIDITYEGLKKSVSDIKSKPKKSYRFLGHVHSLLEISASHYTLDENASERLMLKYYEFLIKIKSFLLDEYNLKILQNINRFPINLDNTTLEFYEKIAEKIEFSLIKKTNKDRFYIQKIKPFFVNSKVYYEVTFTKSHDKVSKFDRIIAFTKLDITQNYAVELFLKEEYIEILGKQLPIVIIDSWRVSIRPCELNNFARIFGINIKLGIAHKEYQKLMAFLTETCLSFNDYVTIDQEYYDFVKNRVLESIEGRFFDVLDICREILLKNKPGSNIISYLLYTMSNKVIKLQTHKEVNFKLSNLYLKWESIPFDQMPFTSSLFNHNPKIYNLFVCINHEKREHEFLGRLVQNNVEIKGKLFTSLEELEKFDEIEVLIKKYNDLIYKKTQSSRLIEVYKDKFICMKGYLENTIQIVEKLKKLSNEGFTNYSNFVNAFIKKATYTIDCEDKKNFLTQMFENSKVAMIYGAAGTGKSTLINHISHVFKEYKKIYLAQTNPAKDNLERKVDVPNTQFMTITKFLSNKNLNIECAVLFIDESSTVSNYDMLRVLNKAEGKYTLLVLVGDIFQIESIRFGNWFEISKDFLPKQTIFELTKPYRSKNNSLITLWDKVRNNKDDISEHIQKNGYSINLDQSIFENYENDEIILCLNYDGLYGINNINRFLQANNPNESVNRDGLIYKVEDPILFNETKRFGDAIYNNLKGKISAITILDNKIRFHIEVDKVLNELDTTFYDFELVSSDSNKSIISFNVNDLATTDEDDELSESVMPFQVAYAVSIHKAQGLEYSSVKIVITDEVEEQITHNIFYTAITRAKNNLKIYWSPETENKILSNLTLRNNRKDIHLLKLEIDKEN